MALQKVEIDKNKVLLPGDRIEMHFKTTGLVWLQAAQIALIEYKIGKRKDFRIISNSLPANNRVIFTVEVIKPPADQPQMQTAGMTGALIAAAILAGTVGIVSFFTLEKIYQIMESPSGKIAVAGSGVGLAALGIAALFLIFRK